MDPREFPTKGNLMLAKNSLALARQGYDLMDKKRNVLLKELMALIDEAKEIQEQIDSTFTKAYACLQRANIEHGISIKAAGSCVTLVPQASWPFCQPRSMPSVYHGRTPPQKAGSRCGNEFWDCASGLSHQKSLPDQMRA